MALDNARAYREIADLTSKLANEKLYLEEEIRSELNLRKLSEKAPRSKRCWRRPERLRRAMPRC